MVTKSTALTLVHVKELFVENTETTHIFPLYAIFHQ